MTQMTIELPDNICKQLNELGRKEGLSPPHMVVDCVQRFLALRQLEELQREIAPYAKAAGWESDEDVFRDVS